MSESVILLNGELSNVESIRPYLKNVSHYIAADGGARHAARYHFPISALIGDFDSISKELLSSYRAKGVEVIEHPVDKDATDLELAIRYAQKHGASVIHLLGNEGGRSDHLVGTMTILGHADFAGVRLWLYDSEHIVTALHGGSTLKIPSSPGARCSLIPISAKVGEVSLTGARWELNRASLSLGQSLGLSNVVTASTIEISVGSGVLLVIVQRQAVPS